MRFSIIIPAYNCENYIREAIDSATNQSVEDIEIIVVVDGSTDKTLARARAIEDPRLRVLTQANAGVMAARQAGLSASTAEAVVFLDSDDRLLPDTLERYALVLEAHPDIGVIYGDRILINSEGRTFGGRRGALLNPHPTGNVLRQLLTRNFLSTPGQACIRSKCLTGITVLGMNFLRGTDWIMFCEIAASHQFAYVGKGPVVEYRVWAHSLARSLAHTGEHAADIEELIPAIRAIYACPAVIEHFPPEELSSLRQATEGSAFAWKGQELLRARQWYAARTCFLEAIRHARLDLRDVFCLGLTYLHAFPPGAKRYIGVP